MNKTLDKAHVSIRGIAPDVMELMTTLAEKNGRSVEGEFRHAVMQYVEPIRLQMEINACRTGLGSRLHSAHRTFLEKHPEHNEKLSYLAQAIGEEKAGPLEAWFDGVGGAPFSTLEKLAGYLGCSSPWLIHGDGEMFDHPAL